MSYRDLKARVASAEHRLEAYLVDAQHDKHAISQTLKQSFTPSRVLLAGVASGLLAGWLRPLSYAGSVSSVARAIAGVPPMFVAFMPWLKTAQAVLDTTQNQSK